MRESIFAALALDADDLRALASDKVKAILGLER
jgi:hypothetical protein